MRMEGLEICRGSGFGERKRERERARPLDKKDLRLLDPRNGIPNHSPQSPNLPPESPK